MHVDDDDLMDQWLTEAMAAERPALGHGFEAQVMVAATPRRLSRFGRAVMAIYIAIAAGVIAWGMQGLPIELIAGSLVAGVVVASATGAYGRRLTSA